MGYSQSKATLDLCVNVLVRPTRIRRASQGPSGRQATPPLGFSPKHSVTGAARPRSPASPHP